MVKISSFTTNAETNAKALQWIASFDVNDATLRDQWIKTVTRYYNGCLPSSSCWTKRYAHYDDSLQAVLDETGLDYWVSKPAKEPPMGWLDGSGCDVIEGWAADPDALETPIDVRLYFGGTSGSGAPSSTVSADIDRADVCDVVGSCNHAFVALTPLSLFDGESHAVHAYGIDATDASEHELQGSPAAFKCTPALPKGTRRRIAGPMSHDAWTFDGLLDQLPLPQQVVLSLAEGTNFPAAPRLVRSDDGSPETWVIDGVYRRRVPNDAVMKAWRFDESTIDQRAAADIQSLAIGPAWRPRPVELVANGASFIVDDVEAGDDGTWPADAASPGITCRAAPGAEVDAEGACWTTGALIAALRRRRRRSRCR